MRTLMISCGEPSGDAYAGALARELRRLEPGVRIIGLGGERLRAAGAELIGDYHGLAVTGLVEALAVLPRAWSMKRALVAGARRSRPDALVLVDFPDFNFRLASSLRPAGVPIVYYVCPQVWAWRRGRLRVMRRLVDRALVIFPFEEAVFGEAGVPAEFVGHPLLDLAPPPGDRRALQEEWGLAPGAPLVALLPGSRPNEVRSTIPTLASAVPLMARRIPGVQFVVGCAPNLDGSLFDPLRRAAGARVALVEGRADDVLRASDAVVTASGTATVQAAIHECPMVIVYRVAPLTYRLGRRVVRLDTFGMANLIAGRRIVPELIQDGFTPEAVTEAAARYFEDPAHAAATRAALREVRMRLGEPGASRRAAERILALCAARPRRPGS
ncbi:MAG TPA: lipid-A-disaccharide synthase [Vicinamibacterales bacterium]|nr:lipid-A-disaccharide synthase [Vicinamibacterales bacterium]HOQ59219.1 lipid-A-disaccharide synthase [Vicinamibacterales bacterium]HPK70722.1 lipid-A-disaccharide synthase [Vicinamibacterales bacterium]